MPWLTRDASDFFAELELNNDRDWFNANKKRYEKVVKEPLLALAEEMIPRMRKLDPEITMQPKDAVFRIYRDTRFSKDKRPYKTNAGMSISSGGKTGNGRPGLYMHVDASSFGIASGHYFLEPAQILAMRRHLVANEAEFERQLKDKDFVKVFGTVRGEQNKILPPEFRDAAARQPLLFNKQFFYWAEYDVDEATRDDLPDFLMMHATVAAPMNAFLTRGLAGS
ncbi:MAG: DUF2461 domain-containing protein [Armatimonadetes bacterium]|nr:DUF2461 domain-containing protein [Armatimonadota bacterium]